MEKLVFVFCLMFLISCGDSIHYSLEPDSVVDDKDKILYQNCISDIVKSASFQMTTSDYERVDDTIEMAKHVCDKMYLKTTQILRVSFVTDANVTARQYFTKEQCTGKKLEMYNKLLENPQTIIEEVENK